MSKGLLLLGTVVSIEGAAVLLLLVSRSVCVLVEESLVAVAVVLRQRSIT